MPEHVKLYFSLNSSEKKVYENDGILFPKKQHADKHGKTETIEHVNETKE